MPLTIPPPMTPGEDIDPDEPEIAPLEADRGFEDYEVAANALGIGD